MKKFIIILLLFAQSGFACGQNKLPEGVPLLINTAGGIFKMPVVEVPSRCVTDTLDVFVGVRVHFDNNIGDTTKTLTPKRIELSVIMYYKDKEKKERAVYTDIDEIHDDYNLGIWKTCEEKSLRYMKYQPYNNMYDRSYFNGIKNLSYHFKIHFIPIK